MLNWLIWKLVPVTLIIPLALYALSTKWCSDGCGSFASSSKLMRSNRVTFCSNLFLGNDVHVKLPPPHTYTQQSKPFRIWSHISRLNHRAPTNYIWIRLMCAPNFEMTCCWPSSSSTSNALIILRALHDGGLDYYHQTNYKLETIASGLINIGTGKCYLMVVDHRFPRVYIHMSSTCHTHTCVICAATD